MTVELDAKQAAARRAITEPPEAEQRVDAIWESMEASASDGASTGRSRVRYAVIGATALAAAAAIGLVVLYPPTTPQPWVGEAIVSGDETLQVALPDGSEVWAETHTEVHRVSQRSEEIVLRLDRGEATFDVSPDPSRAFVVWANEIEVRVIGTRFVVLRTDEAVEVRVERGAVDVRNGDQVERLRPGDQRRFTRDVLAAAEQQSATAIESVPEETNEENSETLSEDNLPGDNPAEETTVEEGAGGATAEAPGPPTSAALFAAAAAARRAGQPAVAANRYEELLRQHPGDARAPIAALELARLRMDVLGQPGRAVAPLQIAVRLGRGSAAAEDAMARLVRVRHTLGQVEACQAAKESYRRRFPGGAHRAQIDALCP
ncbi:MAG: FecR family protein [Myxococcota bacterium]